MMVDKPFFEGSTAGQVAVDAGLVGAFGAGLAGLKNLVTARGAAPGVATAAGEVSSPRVRRSDLAALTSAEAREGVRQAQQDADRRRSGDGAAGDRKAPDGCDLGRVQARPLGKLTVQDGWDRLEGVGALTRELRQKSYAAIEGTVLASLPEDQRKVATVVLSGQGDLPPQQYKTQDILDVAQRVRDDFYDAAAAKMQEAGVKTISTRRARTSGRRRLRGAARLLALDPCPVSRPEEDQARADPRSATPSAAGAHAAAWHRLRAVAAGAR